MDVYRDILKRGADVALVLASAPLMLPLGLALALAVKLESRGPALFRQVRGGLGGKPFTILKFRSMRVDGDAERKGFEPGSRSRITRAGAVLRKTKLDELPQLWNVLVGDMSLVGPRPEVPRYTALYPERWARVLSARPGITDPASVEFRNEEEILAAAADPEAAYSNEILPRKLDLYERYVESISFAGDVKILLKTIFAVLFKH